MRRHLLTGITVTAFATPLRRVARATVALLLATLTACGGGGQVPSATTPPQTVDHVPLTLVQPDGDLVAAYAPILKAKPEWRSLTLRQIEMEWVSLVPLSPDSDEYVMPDGHVVTFPAMNHAGNLRRDNPSVSNAFTCGVNGYSASWNGTTPPNCTNTGLFRRTFSRGGRSAEQATVTLTSSRSTMPAGTVNPNGTTTDPIDGITGYVYEEGWPAVGATDSEAGFQYSDLHDDFSPYIRAPGFAVTTYESAAVASGAVAVLLIQSRSTGTSTVPVKSTASCAAGCIEVTFAVKGGNCPAGNVCAGTATMVASGWVGNCCFMARMTTIARNTQYDFTGYQTPYQFGPIPWSSPYTYTTAGADSKYDLGGTQSYPSSTTYVTATNVQTNTSESDTILLPTVKSVIQ